MKRPEPIRTPAQVSRIGYFRLATPLRLGQLVPDIRLDSPGARLPHFLGGGLLAVVSLAPASPGCLVQLVPDVVLRPTGLLNAARCLGAVLGRVGCVGAALLDGGRTLEAVVGVDPVLKLGGDLPIVIESRSVLERLLVCCDLDELPRVVDPCHLERDQGGTRPQEAHLHAYVLGAIVLVYEQVVYLADLLVVLVVDRVACETILDFLREPLGARLAFQGKYIHIGCFVRTYIANPYPFSWQSKTRLLSSSGLGLCELSRITFHALRRIKGQDPTKG